MNGWKQRNRGFFLCLSLLRSEHPQPARARPGGSRDKGNPGAVSRSQPGENRGEEAPISPSPAAAELGSRVAEHVIHGRKLEIKGEERARARCHPKLLPKVRKGGGEITPPTHMLAHPKDPALLVGAQGGRIHQDALRYAPRLKQRQARLNKKKQNQNHRRCIFTHRFSVPWEPHTSPAKAGEEADAGRAPYAPVRQEQPPRLTPKSSFSHFWVIFFFFQAEETHSTLTWPQESEGMCLIPSRQLLGMG